VNPSDVAALFWDILMFIFEICFTKKASGTFSYIACSMDSILHVVALYLLFISYTSLLVVLEMSTFVLFSAAVHNIRPTSYFQDL